MIKLETLVRKLSFTKPNGDKVIDLTRASLEYKSDVSYTGYTIVTKDFEMRPDLIAESALGDPNKLDYILKFNGISNPLSVYADQIILIPDDNEMAAVFRNPVELTNDEDTEQTILKPKTQKDKNRLELLKAKAKNKEILPPNVNAKGEENITFTDTKIILGSNISNKDPLCAETTTRARLKQKLLNNKIYK